MTDVRDFMGRLIEAGCTVCYPVRRRSSMWMVEMRVQQVVTHGNEPYISGYNSEGRRVTIKNLSNVVVVEPRMAIPQPSLN